VRRALSPIQIAHEVGAAELTSNSLSRGLF
jgi:hypothetical protein